MWIIQNRPEASVAGSPSVYLDPALDGEAYATAKKIWLDHVESRPDNLKIISHAAQFFLLPDRDTAEQLLKKAKALDRDNPEWPERMGFLYMLDMQSANSKKARADAARKALKEYEAAKALSSDTGNQRIAIDLAKTAFEAGELAKAKNYAAQLAKQAGRDNGDAMHHGNLILGRIALRSGDLKTAKMRLLAAGKTPGSPPLSSFGPNMTLAKELLVKGQRSVVIEYLKLCSKFWTSGKDRLDEWTTLIKQGKIPDFGGNANY
jgi:tetratricopeptide (TPR) repeat protein